MPDWLLPITSVIVGLVSGLFGSYVGIRVWQARYEERYSHIRKELDEIWREIGDHTTGIKGRLHSVENKTQAHEMTLAAYRRTGDR